jgi:DnaK suppressor protein
MKQNKNFIQSVEKELIKRRNELAKDISSDKSGNSNSSGRMVMDSGDEVTTLSEETLQDSLKNAEFVELNSISLALERVKTGDYGICADCAELISQKRLQHYPYAIRCIVCQETLEAK